MAGRASTAEGPGATDAIPVSGRQDERFARVRNVFLDNFARHGEVGARVCVVFRGETVVDLWGGWRDEEQKLTWDDDTVVNMFSATKGVTAGCFAMLVSRGLLSYEHRVAEFWPEFGAAGKEGVTVGMMLSHQAGVPGFSDPATLADLLSPAAADRLARQAPMWEPGTASGYHATSYGLLAEALFRRVEGRSVRQFVADELNRGLGLNLSIGLAPGRLGVAAPIIPPTRSNLPSTASLSPPQRAALANPPLDPTVANSREWQEADLPSTNGFGHAGALARFYGLLTAPDSPLVSAEAIRDATRVRRDGVDLVLSLPSSWAAGFLRNRDGLFGPGAAAFGHTGWGGSFGMADPEAGIAIGYTMNRMLPALRDDPRANALIAAVYECL